MNFASRKKYLNENFIIITCFRDIYFLDDPFGFMKDKTGQEIFEDLIVRALAEKTILFVTQELQVNSTHM